jgi:hypothetical protein
LVLLLLFELGVLSGCQSRESTVVRSIPDPLTGQPVEWRASTVGDVEVLTPTADPSAVLFYVKGKPVAMTFTLGDHRFTDVLDGKAVPVATVKSSARTGKPLSISYGDSGLWVIDENFVGQLDTRGRGTPHVAEVWVDGKWQPRTVSGAGRDRRYFVGDKEVVLTPQGWQFAPK